MTENNDSKDNPKNSSAVFADYARYYDLLYRDKDYEGEVNYLEGLLRRFLPEAKTVLELGSGTGIHAMHLVKRGYDVTGVEISPTMIKIASSKLKNKPPSNPLFIEGDIRNIRLNQTYDAVIALFHVISYQTTNADVMAAFETARKHLTPGGIFIFDIWYGPAVLTERPEVRIKRMGDDHVEITRLAEPVLHPNENLVDVNYHVFVRDLCAHSVNEFNEKHIMRYFFKPEIDLWAAVSDFTVETAEEWLTAKPFSPTTWSVCFVLRTA